MRIVGGSVGVVGGSIAGCAAAIALARSGAEVTVLERSPGALRDRGAGIVLSLSLFDELCSASYLDADQPVCRAQHRLWLMHDGSVRAGRLMWRQPFPAVLNSWSVLWRALRARIPDANYHSGTAVSAVSAQPDCVTVATPGGERAFDAVVGADGHGSVVAAAVGELWPTADAGYVLWRGTLPADSVDDEVVAQLLRDSIVTLCFASGHAIVYLVPDPDDGPCPLVNWAVYTHPPSSIAPGTHRFFAPGSLPPDLVGTLHGQTQSRLPPAWNDLIVATPSEHIALQPIHDRAPTVYARGRLLLTGDAAALSRPHTGSGAVKALQDCLTLERLAREEPTWPAIALAYETERRGVGDDLVRLGRHLGRILVEQTPDWSAMTGSEVASLIASVQAGSRFWAYDTREPAS